MKYHPEGKRGVALGVAHDAIPAARSRRSSPRPTQRTTFFCQIETGRGRGERRRHRGGRRRRLPVGRAFRPVGLARHPRRVRAIRNSSRRSTPWSRACRKHKKALGRLVPNVATGIDFYKLGLRLHLLFRRRLGAAECADRGGRDCSAPAARSGDATMADKFRVALSGDFKKPDGSPTFPDFDLAPLRKAPGVEVVYLDAVQSGARRTRLADFDALILLMPRFARDSIHPNGRLAVVARFGVGYDNVDVPACTEAGIALVITPDGVRRPVAVSIITFMLALTGKLLIKDRLDPRRARRLQPARRPHGRRPGRPDPGLARHRQYRRRAVPPGQALRHALHRPRSLTPTRRSRRSWASSWSSWRSCSAVPTCCRVNCPLTPRHAAIW